MKVLLHACCGPCLLEPFDALSAEHEVDIVYANPNIHPVSEYERRRDTLLAYAQDRSMVVTEIDYDPGLWSRAVAGFEDDPARRCRACYRLRLGLTAAQAVAGGYDAISTTLSVSPYQDPIAIAEEGHAAAAAVGLRFLERDFRDRYPEATRRSRELGMYRQNYCGCRFSELEARAEREERRARRRAERNAGGSGPEEV